MSNIELVHHNNQGGDRNDPVSNVKAQISGDNVYRLLKYESKLCQGYARVFV